MIVNILLIAVLSILFVFLTSGSEQRTQTQQEAYEEYRLLLNRIYYCRNKSDLITYVFDIQTFIDKWQKRINHRTLYQYTSQLHSAIKNKEFELLMSNSIN